MDQDPPEDATAPPPPGGYSESMLRELLDGFVEARSGLRDLQARTLVAAQSLPESLVRQHLQFGVARRASYMHRILCNIFDKFPPEARVALPPDDIAEATINL